MIRRSLTGPRKTPKMGVRQNTGPMRSPGHLAWIRKRNSVLPFHSNNPDLMRVDPSHVDYWQAAHPADDVPKEDRGGEGIKYGDQWVFPLYRGLHIEWHAHGGKAFAKKYGINPHKIAKEFAAASPHRKDFIRDA